MKTLKYIAISAVIMIGLAACEKKDNNRSIENEVVSEQAYVDLLNQLDEYNANFEFDSTGDNMLKRGGRGRTILGCDLTGALAGSVLGIWGAIGFGAVFSLMAAMTTEHDATTTNDLINQPIYSYEIIDNEVGKWHNIIIEEIMTDHPNVLDGGYTEKELLELVGGKLEAYNIATIEEFEKSYQGKNASLIKEISKATDIESIASSTVKIYPELQSEVQVLKKYMTNVEKNVTIEKKVMYTEGVGNIINKSDLSASAKKSINSATSVYVNSSALWK